MKHCPKCRRGYVDETLNYCRDDGTPLLTDTSSLDEPPATLIFPASKSSDSQPTKSLNVAASASSSRPTSRRRSRKAVDSLAVLPLINASADPDMEYLSDGISESLINSLSQLPRVKVIARSSSFKYKGKEADPQKVAKALDVKGILTGRVARRGENLLISVELRDARSNTNLGRAV